MFPDATIQGDDVTWHMYGPVKFNSRRDIPCLLDGEAYDPTQRRQGV